MVFVFDIDFVTVLLAMWSRVCREENETWVGEKLEAHIDWVRDVAWCPSVGLPLSRIASCSQVRIWLGGVVMALSYGLL